jgi:hypothetical protein
MKFTAKISLLMVVLVFCLLPVPSQSQNIVFEGSRRATGDAMYNSFRSQLESWGYTVSRNTGAIEDITGADVIVMLPADCASPSSDPYTVSEAAWLKNFVDQGGGFFGGVCPNDDYYNPYIEVMNVFGIAEHEVGITSPNTYDDLHHEILFYNVTEIGSDFSYSTALNISSPSVAIGGNGTYDGMALYTGAAPSTSQGYAIWFTLYMMLETADLSMYDNAAFLQNAFELLSSGTVPTDRSTWDGVKALYR